jgi:phosphodiesterase/alkaline phosphatase D-like protein
MTTRRVAVALAAAAGALPASAHGAGQFPYGVTAAEVTSTSAVLWTRVETPGLVQLRVTGTRGLPKTLYLRPRSDTDFTVQRRVTGLRPGTGYQYAFSSGSVETATGLFRTAPPSKRRAPVKFAFSGDADAQPLTPGGAPAYNAFQVYDRMARERNAFNINVGDTIYSDSEVAGLPPALTVADKWAKYKQNLAMANLRKVRASAAMYNQWDDHEFINDFTRDENGSTIYDAGVQAFLDYMPATFSASNGLYRSFRWGRNLEVFFLDERSFRSAKASANHACDNPDTGTPDLVPALPQRLRDLFGAIEPSLKRPISPACLAALSDPARTMLGASQLARFENAIKRSKATWKVIVNEVPIQQFYALPYDRWEGYEAERLKLVRFLRANVRNAVFLTTDHHANLVNTVKYTTLEPAGVKGSGIYDFATGPVATRTFAKEIDDTLGRPGTADLVRGAFFKPAPPNGIGMKCAALDSYSYAQIKVTAKRFRLALKDLNGRTVREADGRRCGPYTLKAKRR